ncbi:MAG: LLM class F420-dependent oxidoreductase [Candidatus Dadabacteria bacterium]|nr:MAG: LLM class F420-dependent oxidoreductase [Candidatus Dadabacteria bacterium]
MKLGLTIGYSGRHININWDLIRECEEMGYDSVWTAESWGSDAVSPLAWIGARHEKLNLGTSIMQMPGRSPANTAMTALTMQQLSGGRFKLGLGTSGPQVVEGWHGKPWYKPLTMTREYITVVKKILAREEPLEFHGEFFDIPFRGEHSKGLGKPLKSMIHPTEPIPIHLGSMAPKGQQLCGEICDGVHLTCMIPEKHEVITDNLKAGFEKRTDGKKWEDFEIIPMVAVALTESVDLAQGAMYPLKYQLALYIGGMGAKNKNFYKDFWVRSGFEEESNRIQELFLNGDREGAVRAVTDEMVQAAYLVGTRDQIAERFEAWKNSPATTIMVGAIQPEAIRLLAELNQS